MKKISRKIGKKSGKELKDLDTDLKKPKRASFSLKKATNLQKNVSDKFPEINY